MIDVSWVGRKGPIGFRPIATIRLGAVAATAVTLASLAGAPAALGAQLFAAPAPTGQNSGNCTASDPPCTLQRAVEVVAGPTTRSSSPQGTTTRVATS